MANPICHLVRLVLVLGLVAVSAAGLTAQSGDSKKDQEKFQGTWEFTAAEKGGKDDPSQKGTTVTIEGDKFTVRAGGKVVQAGTFKLDATQKPKTIDATVTEGDGKGTTMLGIYELDGDTHRVCFDPEGKKRPTGFKTTADTGQFLIMAKRVKK
jgi:uncharacterized protein (TIGR03067 family)